MRRLTLGILLAMALGPVVAQAETQTEDVSDIPPYEPVRYIWAYGGFHDFDVIDDDTLLLWTTPFDPYLVELRIPSHDLAFAQTIAVESTGDHIYSQFDTVRIAGLRYPIGEIYKLSRDEARQLLSE
jgi:hypothetical protein